MKIFQEKLTKLFNQLLNNLILRAGRHVILKNEILEQSECMKNHANLMLHEEV